MAAPSQHRAIPVFFQHVTNVDLNERQLPPLLSGERPPPVGAHTMRDIAGQLKRFLGISQDEGAKLLGVSRSTLAKAEPPSGDVLDRLYAVGKRFDTVRAVLGDQASNWFRTPHPALDGERPLDELRTRYGQDRLDDLIQGLLDGNFY